jgi:hypothetical protein
MMIPMWVPWLCYAIWTGLDVLNCIFRDYSAEKAVRDAFSFGLFTAAISFSGWVNS